MYRRKSTLVLSILLIVALSACNLPEGSSDATATPDLAQTLTALASNGGQPTASGQQETATPEFTATPILTATPSIPQVTVSTDTNCRTGPGVVYDNIGALFIGQVGTVVGKNSQTGYWIINNPGKTGTCWLFPQYATVTGNTANLQEYSIPPTPTPTATSTPTQTPTPSIPAPANNPIMNMICIPIGPNYNHSGVLTWEDKSNNETGFNIYVNGGLIGTVPADTVIFNVPPIGPFAPGIASLFGVEAYNATGKATIKTVLRACP